MLYSRCLLVIYFICSCVLTDRFKGLDLVGRVPEELWWRFMVLYKAVIKTIPKKKEMKKGKMVV